MSEYDEVKKAAETFVIRKMSNDMTDDETEEFETWLRASSQHQKAFQAAQSKWEAMSFLEGKLVDPAPDQVSPAPETIPEQMKQPRNRFPAGSALYILQQKVHHLISFCKTYKEAVTAVVVFFTVFTYVFGEQLWMKASADMLTASGEQRQIKLDDGTLVFLNTDTAIQVDYTKDQRLVSLLKGEIYVDVKPDVQRPFVVETSSGTAKAVGTAFSVRKKEYHVQVIVAKGQVAISPHEMRRNKKVADIQLIKNETVEFKIGDVVAPSKTIKADKALAWRQGKIIFEDTEFSKVLKELDRYYPGKIMVAEITQRSGLVNGIFDKDHIVDAIKAVAHSQGLAARETPGGFMIVIH